mmetsp:Transcript_69298/g.223971  ORF Transcript_69298/g.223971 Transcript_69298/m.223971 type:complete len:234 (-) Transcript_69298:4275-4976(-)
MRMTPKDSSLFGPSRTSTNSPASSFRKVVLTLMSNSLVMAISFTHLKYRSSIAKKLRRLTLLAPPLRMSICFCSSVRLRPGKLSKCLPKAASEMCSAFPPASSAKSASTVVPREWMELRMAADTWPSFACTRLSLALRTLPARASALLAMPSTDCCSFSMSCLASYQGPLVAAATLPSCAARHSLASATTVETLPAAASAALRVVKGAETDPSSDSLTEVSGAAASTNWSSAA